MNAKLMTTFYFKDFKSLYGTKRREAFFGSVKSSTTTEIFKTKSCLSNTSINIHNNTSLEIKMFEGWKIACWFEFESCKDAIRQSNLFAQFQVTKQNYIGTKATLLMPKLVLTVSNWLHRLDSHPKYCLKILPSNDNVSLKYQKLMISRIWNIDY